MNELAKQRLAELEHYQWCRELDEKLALAKARHFDYPNPRKRQLLWYDWVASLQQISIAKSAIKKFKEMFKEELK